jgi:tRNA G10  N-methylase Trm11
MTICILGRQPKIALAELESLYGSANVREISGDIAVVESDSVDLSRLGGTVRIAKQLATIDTTNFGQAIDHVRKYLPEHIRDIPEGKIKLGLSVYGLPIPLQKLNASALSLKKIIRNAGRSIRVVPNQELQLNSAQVMHNQLTSPLGLELILVRDGDKVLLGQTIQSQNIDDYTLRDRMLPPKLAQIMINLAVDQHFGLPSAEFPQVDGRTPVVLDPFCGTGVVLQEAALMGFDVYGSDNQLKMIDYTRANLEWFRRTYDLSFNETLEVADATTHKWQQPFDTIVCETYLGQPMSSLPLEEKLQSIIHSVNELHRGFFKNLHDQLPENTRITVAVPAWRVKDSFYHLPVLDDLENLGYNRLDFARAAHEDLIYHREDQIVARELLVLTRK